MQYFGDDFTDKQDYSDEFDINGNDTNNIGYFLDCK